MEISYKNFKVGTCAGQKSGGWMCSTSGLAQPYVCKIRCIPFHAFSTLFKAWKTTRRNTWSACSLVTAIETEFSSTKGRFCYLGTKVRRQSCSVLAANDSLKQTNICSLQNHTSNRTRQGVPQKYNVVRPESCLNYHVNSSSNARSSKSSDLTSL
ncbi:hypothetical protein NC651_019068 [Populus alba x Populus x berolinensis]|nr:hypothetical protein NC651_019068 [Populus alba x Populus x berolinensis]